MNVQVYVSVDTENRRPKRIVTEVRKIAGVVRTDVFWGRQMLIVIDEGDDIARMHAVIDKIAGLSGFHHILKNTQSLSRSWFTRRVQKPNGYPFIFLAANGQLNLLWQIVDGYSPGKASQKNALHFRKEWHTLELFSTGSGQRINVSFNFALAATHGRRLPQVRARCGDDGHTDNVRFLVNLECQDRSRCPSQVMCLNSYRILCSLFSLLLLL